MYNTTISHYRFKDMRTCTLHFWCIVGYMCTAHVSATFIEKCVHDLILLNPGLAITKLAYNMRDTPVCTPTGC